jgi:signal transduction histidine kinase
MQPDTWLKAAGFVTWLAGGVPVVASIAEGRMAVFDAAIWAAAFVAFGIAFGSACTERFRVRTRLLLVIQAAAGLTTVASSHEALGAATLVVVAAQLIGPFAPSVAGAWVAVQTLALVLIFARFTDIPSAITAGGAFLGFQVFALATASLAVRERTAREALARANAELHATHALLAEDSRVAERLRISRDLHDTLGHHLTALSLQLEVASRLASGAAADRVTEAHAITRLLLGDVRDVVGRLRETSHFDLGAAIRMLADAAAPLHVHLDIAEGISVDDPLQAHAILRCVQEVITNTMRHAQARNLWISLDRRPDGVALTAKDDGQGVDAVAWGNGLRGMRERFEELSGRVDFSSKPGAGFEVQAFVPK